VTTVTLPAMSTGADIATGASTQETQPFAATSAVIVSVDAHCPTSSTASALSAVSVTLFGEVTNRLSNPLGSVHHGKMARLIAGNGKNRQVAMASDAGLAEK